MSQDQLDEHAFDPFMTPVMERFDTPGAFVWNNNPDYLYVIVQVMSPMAGCWEAPRRVP